MVLIKGAIGVLGPNAHTIQTYSPTWTNARVWHYHANGDGVGFGAIL